MEQGIGGTIKVIVMEGSRGSLDGGQQLSDERASELGKDKWQQPPLVDWEAAASFEKVT